MKDCVYRFKNEIIERSPSKRLLRDAYAFRTCPAEDTVARFSNHIGGAESILRILVRNRYSKCHQFMPISIWTAIFRLPGQKHCTEGIDDYKTARSTGKGLDDVQAKAAALSEALEWFSAYHCGDLPDKEAPFNEVHRQALAPNQLLGYSMRQLVSMESKGEALPRDDDSIQWVQAADYHGKDFILVPATLTYFAHPDSAVYPACQADSSGLASGNCQEEAMLYGLLECIERDSVGIWWYNRLTAPEVAWRKSIQTDLKSFGAFVEDKGIPVNVFDLTSDLGLPVYAACAIVKGPFGSVPVIGTAAHLNACFALRQALCEMFQMSAYATQEQTARSYAVRMAKLLEDGSQDASFFLRSDHGPAYHIDECAYSATLELDAAIATVITALASKGFSAYFLDQTRPEVGLPVIRSIIPGLCQIQPRFGIQRLYRVPIAGMCRHTELSEQQLNPVAFI